jgi:hypothetical protein
LVWHENRNYANLPCGLLIDQAVLPPPHFLFFINQNFMHDEGSMHFLRLSGIIASNKEKEFEQTVQFVFNQLSSECLEKVLSNDMHKKDHYHLFYLWSTAGALKKFMGSIELQLIIGAFDTLGTLEHTIFGTCVEKPSFHSKDLN